MAHNYGHSVFNAKLPERRLPPTPNPHVEERHHSPLRGYDDDERSLPMVHDSYDDMQAPPHYRNRGETVKQHVQQQRQQGFTHPRPETQEQPQPRSQSLSSSDKLSYKDGSKRGMGCFPQSQRGRANCIACVACAILVVLVVTAIIAVVVWKVIYCELRATESKSDVTNPNFYMSCDGKNSSYCSLYFDYEFSGNSKEGSSCCSSQTDYLCVYQNQISQLSPPTAANKLKVMSFNIYERPLYLGREGQRERTCRIPKWIFSTVPDVDVIAFQEVFSDGCWGSRSSMRDMLKHHGFMYSTQTVDEDNVPINGGSFIASRWPIQTEKAIIFEAKNTKSLAGLFIPKGVNYAKITKTSAGETRVYHIFDTHLETDRGDNNDKAREDQAKELQEFADLQSIPSTEPVIIAGDFNIDYHTQQTHFNNVFNTTLKAELPQGIAAGDFTFDTSTNLLLESVKGSTIVQEWLDYVLYLRDYLQPTLSTFGKLIATWNSPIPMCWDPDSYNVGGYRTPYSSECHDTNVFQELSDHHAVVADFTFP